MGKRGKDTSSQLERQMVGKKNLLIKEERHKLKGWKI